MLEEKVARGALLMDEIFPDWYKHVDTKTLDISSISACVLSQVFGGYITALEAIDGHRGDWMDVDQQVDHGFDGDDIRELLDLTNLWILQILERRQA